MVAGCGSEETRASRAAPAEQVLAQLCDESVETARAQLAVAGQVARIDNSLGLSGAADSVECEGDAWTIEVDGQQARVETAMIFNAVADPGEPEADYCDTEGVNVQLPVTGFEEREFDGNPYCFSWYSGDPAQSASISYVDMSTEIYLTWHITFDGDAFDTDTPLGSLLAAANDAVLAGIYERFSEETS
jgi:hypothetical protein